MNKKINWKVRLQSRTFLVTMFSALLTLINQISALFGYDLTVYNDTVTDIAQTILLILMVLGIVVDNTTSGITDSQRALHYKKPGGDL